MLALSKAKALFLLFLVSVIGQAQDTIIPLWPEGRMPNYVASEEKEEQVQGEDLMDMIGHCFKIRGVVVMLSLTTVISQFNKQGWVPSLGLYFVITVFHFFKPHYSAG